MKVKTEAVIRVSNSWRHAAPAPDKVVAWDRLPVGCAVPVLVLLSLPGWALLLILLLRWFNDVDQLRRYPTKYEEPRRDMATWRRYPQWPRPIAGLESRGSAVGAAVGHSGLATDAHRQFLADLRRRWRTG
jgi:hypothetical protein